MCPCPLFPDRFTGTKEEGIKQEIEENVQVLLVWLSLHPAPGPRAEGVTTFTESASVGFLEPWLHLSPQEVMEDTRRCHAWCPPPGDLAALDHIPQRSSPPSATAPTATSSPSSSLSPSQHNFCTHSILRLFRFGATFHDQKPWGGLPLSISPHPVCLHLC